MEKDTLQTIPSSRRRSSGRTFQVTKEEIQSPWIAWPTVILGIMAPLLWAVSLHQIAIASTATTHHSTYYYSILSFVACFLCFTPAHDAAHRAIGRSTPFARMINEIIGRISVLPLLSPFPAFRHVHLLHHKYTNDPLRDPDYYSQGGVWYCFFQELYYYCFCFQHYQEISIKTWVESLTTLALTIWGIYYGFQTLGSSTMIWGVLFPQRLAVVYLAYCFDYVPHHEASGKPQTNPYLTTKRITNFFGGGNEDQDHDQKKKKGGHEGEGLRLGGGGGGGGGFKKWLLRLVVANQDAHVIHHLYPTLPFYRYHDVWDQYEKELYEAGVQKTSLF